MRLFQVLLFLTGFAGHALAASTSYWHRSASLDYRVAADGTSSATEVWDVKADTNAIAQTIAQQSFSYVADLETVDLVAAYTRKSDGTIIPVPAGSVMDKAVTTSASAPQFSELEVRTIVFPQVVAGDTVHYELRRTAREPMFPGEFTTTLEAGAGSTTDRADITLALAPGRTLRTASSGLQENPAAVAPDGYTIRRWSLIPGTQAAVALDVSTFADYAAVGAAYAARAWPQSQPDPTIDALALKLAPPGLGEREIALRLYRYVASNVRYVATFLGNGRVVPRDADTVLAEGWGDCKDHTALLQALLAARGIKVIPALISLHNRYDLPAAPGLGALDHVIAYLPSLDLYLDSTAPYAPFGLLLAGEYDKPVVLADIDHPRLSRTPPMPQGAIALDTRTIARVAEDGSVSGRTTTRAEGPQSIALRAMAAWFEGRGTGSAAYSQLQLLGTPGTGRYAFESPDNATAAYRVDGRFTLDDPLLGEDAVPFQIPNGLGVFGRPGKQLLSSNFTEDGGHACYPGSETEEIELDLPASARPEPMPAEIAVTAGGASYTAHYTLDDGVLHVRREFRLETDHERCTQAEFEQMRPVLNAARRDQQARISLAREPTRVVAGPL